MHTFDEIAARLSDARACGSTLRGTCPACGGGNLSLTRYGSDDLGWLKCFNCDTAGANLLQAVAGEPVKVPVPIARRRQVSTDERTARAGLIWREAQPIENTLAECYLRNRGIVGPLPATLRFHAAVWHSEAKRRLPAMIGAICKPERSLTGVHCTFLDPDSGKAKVEPVKKMMGAVRGCAVHLDRITDGTLAICEGIETGLAFQLLWDIPTWACLSTSGLLTFEPPAGIRRIIIAGDADANGRGQDAAGAAKDRIEECYPGIAAEVHTPDAGLDWADVLLEGT